MKEEQKKMQQGNWKMCRNLASHKNDVKVINLGELKSYFNSVSDVLNEFLRIRLVLYISSDKNYYADKI